MLLGLDSSTFWNGVREAVTYEDVSGGFLKAALFGLLTMTICTYQGYNTHLGNGARGVRAVTASTTRAVVHSSVGILVVNYLITSFLV
jgi:phospholipid/cholesterol/gamma-HCH transport system permease protein